MGHNNQESSNARISPKARPLRRSKLVGVILAVVASLVVFPSGVSYLGLAWMLAALLFYVFDRRRFAGMCCIALSILLVVKSPSSSVSFFLLVVGSLSAAAVIRLSKSKWSCRAALLLSLLVAIWFSVDRWVESTAGGSFALDDSRPVVCIGDSLTEGVKGGFPAELQKLVTPPVINLGRNGYTTQMAIDDLLPQLKMIKPQLVVVELGGHDYNTGESRSDTKGKLRFIIDQIKSAGAAVVLVEIPRGVIQDPFYGLERELTREFDLELIPDTIVRRCFYFSPIAPPGIWLDKKYHLSDDGLHPNDRGQVEFAAAVAMAIGRMQD